MRQMNRAPSFYGARIIETTDRSNSRLVNRVVLATGQGRERIT